MIQHYIQIPVFTYLHLPILGYLYAILNLYIVLKEHLEWGLIAQR